jgi:hypothetical protein
VSLARQFANAATPVTASVTPRNQPSGAKPHVAMVTVTRAEHDKVVAEVEKLRAEVAELKEIIMSLPWFSASAPVAKVDRQPSKRDRAAYMREYRKHHPKKAPK